MERKEALKIDIKLGKKRVKLDLGKMLKVDPNPATINEQFATQPANFAWVGVLFAYAHGHLEEMKLNKQTVFAQRSAYHRKYREDNGLKFTDKIIDADVRADEKYIKAKENLVEAERNHKILEIAKQSFAQRKDILIETGRNLRAEGDNDLVVLKEEARKKVKKGKK